VIKVDNIVNSAGDNDSGIDLTTNDVVAVKTADTERCRVDASGNLLVGHTGSIFNNINATSTVGSSHSPNGEIFACSDQSSGVMFLNRKSTDGSILTFRKDGTTVGSIGIDSYGLYMDGESAHTGLQFIANNIIPRDNGARTDNATDMGGANNRFDDIYATNGTIQTSDQNEKQQIASLTDAEITAAKAISKLFKTFKWKDKVAAKGDAARTHTGVIAQDVEAAMTDAGLDAGDYAFFISTDWHVDADGNEVEADAEGAIAKNRKGIRYPELLAFVGAATEQRLADIETRLTALETA
jgi:hypothetical protein